MRKQATVIVDLQFGSTGKGLIAGYLAKRNKPDTVVCAFAPNAGHTFEDEHGNRMVTCSLPTGIVSPSVKVVLLGPGSVIDPDLLVSEIDQFIGSDSLTPQVYIHEHAAVVTEGHRAAEAQGMVGIGSTMKGVGAATIDKIRRLQDGNSNTARDMLGGTVLESRIISHADYIALISRSNNLQIEGAQGYSLGINSGFYPYTTSRECTVPQLLSDCAVPFNMFDLNIVGSCRTYPIRVANRFDSSGKQVGWSGPSYWDQMELSWEQVGLPVEYTTVTKLPRRVFTFSLEQVRQAVLMNGVTEVFLNFANYFNSFGDVDELLGDIANETGVPVRYLGYGARESDVIDMRASFLEAHRQLKQEGAEENA